MAAAYVDVRESTLDLGTLLRTMLRRWPFVLAVALLTLLVTWRFASSVEPTYEAKASVLLLGPAERAGAPTNPYSEFARPLETTARALALVVNGQQVRDTLRAAGYGGTYSVLEEDGEPILAIEVSSDDREDATATLEAVVTEIGSQLERRQENAGSPEELLINSEVLDRPARASANYGSRDRFLAGIFVLGIAAMVSVAVLAETVAVRRRARTIDADEQVAPAAPPPPPLDDHQPPPPPPRRKAAREPAPAARS